MDCPLKEEGNKDRRMRSCFAVADRRGAEGRARSVRWAGEGRMRVLVRRVGLGLDGAAAEVDDAGRWRVRL